MTERVDKPKNIRGMRCRKCKRPLRVRSAPKSPLTRRHAGRGLCSHCLKTVSDNGTIETYPRLYWPRELLLAEWQHFANPSLSVSQVAVKIGISAPALQKALERARKAGIEV